jgi:thioredoxin reductase (NADPH)
MREQSERFGTKIITETVSRVDLSTRPFKYWLEYGEENAPNTADTLIIATGASAKRLHLPGEDTYWQSGISACAVCDGAVPIFRNKPLAVIGGGDSAAEEAIFLTKYGEKVVVLVRKDKLRASNIMAKRLSSHPKVEILYNTVAIEAKGDGRLLQSLVIKNVVTGETSDLAASGLFYAVGHKPATALFQDQIDTDEDGYIITKPGTSYTSVKGVFAAGDVQDKRYRQAITSAGMFPNYPKSYNNITCAWLIVVDKGRDVLRHLRPNGCWQRRRRRLHNPRRNQPPANLRVRIVLSY